MRLHGTLWIIYVLFVLGDEIFGCSLYLWPGVSTHPVVLFRLLKGLEALDLSNQAAERSISVSSFDLKSRAQERNAEMSSKLTQNSSSASSEYYTIQS